MNDTPKNWLDEVKWTEDGLVPAIAQDAESGDVLMLAWMNQESLALTVREGRAVYWSRSRQRLWRKGEESGHVQVLHDIRLDCDNDVILLQVEQLLRTAPGVEGLLPGPVPVELASAATLVLAPVIVRGVDRDPVDPTEEAVLRVIGTERPEHPREDRQSDVGGIVAVPDDSPGDVEDWPLVSRDECLEGSHVPRGGLEREPLVLLSSSGAR